ncbi:MAG: lipoyl synthase, partial [Odoribacter sp.]|nr:lipoyl synthase [Odoribacter sp.]
MKVSTRRKPDWLKIRLPMGQLSVGVQHIIRDNNLHTICTSGKCPNQAECWGCGMATFMIGGNICTRACRFCNVQSGRPLPLDENEPQHIAKVIKNMGLKHAVITSVDRDDIEDFGATHWLKVIQEIKKENPQITMEVLIPDFQGREEFIQMIIAAKPEVISHNLETVERLTPRIRSKATYKTSLQVLKQVSQAGVVTKSGIMLGLGETEEEILQTMDDLQEVGCHVMTIGQYLQPSPKNVEVEEYITP